MNLFHPSTVEAVFAAVLTGAANPASAFVGGRDAAQAHNGVAAAPVVVPRLDSGSRRA